MDFGAGETGMDLKIGMNFRGQFFTRVTEN